MNEKTQNKKINDCRAAAAACITWAESNGISDATRLRWRKLAEEWLRLAEEADRMLSPPSDPKVTK